MPGIAILRCVDDDFEQDRAVLAGVIVEHLENVPAHELVLPDVHGPVIHAVRLDRVEDLDSATRPGLRIGEPRLLGHRTAVSIAYDWRAHFFILMATGTARAFDGVRLNDGVSATGLVHLRAAGTSLLLDCGGTLLPRVLHWGADLGELSDDDMAALLRVSLFGHFGIEWDLTLATDAERTELARWIALYKEVRDLLHTGDIVRADAADPQLWVHGVVSSDRSRGIFALVQLGTSVQSPAGRVRLPGLDPDGRYRLTPLEPGNAPEGPTTAPLPWWATQPELPGRALAEVGVQAPTLFPERLVLLDVERIS